MLLLRVDAIFQCKADEEETKEIRRRKFLDLGVVYEVGRRKGRERHNHSLCKYFGSIDQFSFSCLTESRLRGG